MSAQKQIKLLPFEKEFLINELKGSSVSIPSKSLNGSNGLNLSNASDRSSQEITTADIENLSDIKITEKLKNAYGKLSAWDKVLIARHENRPLPRDYISHIVSNFTPFCGDRSFAEDNAMICGFGIVNNTAVVVCGNHKGKNDRQHHNFGMAHPEGYKKFLRCVEFANDFSMPIITFVDTPGAFPGVAGEERGQSYALAKCLYDTIDSKVPMITVITGEGGSGGALALAIANKILMLEHAVYSVISPEGCAAILWKDAQFKEHAAEIQKMTASDLLELGIIDEIISEGIAHRDDSFVLNSVKSAIEKSLSDLKGVSSSDISHHRQEKFLNMTRQFLI